MKFMEMAKNIAIKTGKELSKHSPEIMLGIGVVCFVTAAITAVAGTTKAIPRIEEKKREMKVSKLPVKEVVKDCWKCYVPTITLILAGSACVLGGQTVNTRRNAALAAACSVTERAYSELKSEVTERMGTKAVKEMREAAIAKRSEGNKEDKNIVIMTGENQKVLCYDMLYGKYFHSTMEDIRRAMNDINYEMVTSEYASLNDFYEKIGTDTINVGEMVGWNIGRTGLMDIIFDGMIIDGKPAITIEYTVAPITEFNLY